MLQQQRNWYACYYYYCVATLNHNWARLTIVNLRHSYRKKELIFVIKILRGLYGKIDTVQEILLSFNFNIFSLSETSISEDFHNTFFDIRGYSFIRRYQKSGQGGSVGLYIRDGIDFARRSNLENDETESLWVEIWLKNVKPFIFGTIYKPPDFSKHSSKNLFFPCQKHCNQLIVRSENQLSWVTWM